MKKAKLLAFVASLAVVSALVGVSLLQGAEPKEESYMHVSWIYNFRDIEEISQASDVIGVVTVDGLLRSYMDQNLWFSQYTVTVTTPVLNLAAGESLTIVMTGKDTKEEKIEIVDDPLLKRGEKFLVFCQKNADGTHTILSGPQGRLSVVEGRLYSLNLVNDRVGAAHPNPSITVDGVLIEDMIGLIQAYVSER
jgi:hypothetical protein